MELAGGVGPKVEQGDRVGQEVNPSPPLAPWLRGTMPRTDRAGQQHRPLPRRLLVKLKRCAAVNDLVESNIVREISSQFCGAHSASDPSVVAVPQHRNQCDAWIAKIGASGRGEYADVAEQYAEQLLQQVGLAGLASPRTPF